MLGKHNPLRGKRSPFLLVFLVRAVTAKRVLSLGQPTERGENISPGAPLYGRNWEQDWELQYGIVGTLVNGTGIDKS